MPDSKESFGRPITFEENKKIQMEILKYFDQFCSANHLTYYLSDGTLLGAIRHKGYIPWDDDIDVEMPRDDINRLRKLFVNQGNYQLVFPTDPDSRYHCTKIYDRRTVKIEDGIRYKNNYLGIDIDIFALDGSAEDQAEYEKDRKTVNDLYNRACAIKSGCTGSLRHRCKVVLYRLLYGSPEKMMKRALEICERHNYVQGKFATRYGRFGLGYRLPKECYETTVMKEFEGLFFPVSNGYEDVLNAQFDDYMQLPPEEERKPHHHYQIYWKTEVKRA